MDFERFCDPSEVGGEQRLEAGAAGLAIRHIRATLVTWHRTLSHVCSLAPAEIDRRILGA